MKRILLFLALFLTSFYAYSQVQDDEIISKDKNGKAELINFKETKIKSDEKSVNNFLKKQFKNSENEFKLKSKVTIIENNLEAKKYQQYYKGIKVEFGVQNIVSKNGELKVANGKYVDIKNILTVPKISEKEALEFALKNINAKEYMWENTENDIYLKKEQNNPEATYLPKSELVIIEKYFFDDNSEPRLAYKFNITAKYPYDVITIYVDAENGEVIHEFSEIETVIGIANTRYSGQRNIETQQVSTNQYKLRDYTRGQGIETLNMNNGGNYASATDFIDNDNNWTTSEYNNANKDDAALDAHWGAEKVYDYFLQKYNRNSIDNQGFKLINYVHANLPQINSSFANNDNAFWDGSRMTYGDGTYVFSPLTSIDVIAHEISHGLNSKTANLGYFNESGAINEGLSDVWGAMVEYFADPTKQTYLIGEEIKIGGGALRSMSSPKSYNQPDTYGGQFWYNQNGCVPTNQNDKCGVHTNSGVFNHWFYILAEGKTGTNDLGNSYNIVGIGKEDAAKIVYRAETVYFTPSTNYSQARDLTIQAAKDLFGVNSVQTASVCQSWYAVGVGNSCVVPITIDGNQNICSQGNYTYSISNMPPNTSASWTYSTDALNFVNSTNNSITVSPKTSTYNGISSVTATVNGQSYTKEIWIGKPLIDLSFTPQGINYVAVDMVGANNTDINKQGITSTTWEKLSSSGGCNGIFGGSGFSALGHGSCNTWSVYAKITATNSCGTTTIYRTITPPAPEECNTYTLANNNGIMTIIVDPCGNTIAPYSSNEIYHYLVYNANGFEVLNQTSSNLNTTTLATGVYYVKVFKNNQLILSTTILK